MAQTKRKQLSQKSAQELLWSKPGMSNEEREKHWQSLVQQHAKNNSQRKEQAA